MERELTKQQAKYIDKYLIKSGEELLSFMNKSPHTKVMDIKGVGWIEYAIKDDIFWIETAFSKTDHSLTKLVWERIVKIAKDKGCTTIQCATIRNPKAFERLFNLKAVEWKLEYKIKE